MTRQVLPHPWTPASASTNRAMETNYQESISEGVSAFDGDANRDSLKRQCSTQLLASMVEESSRKKPKINKRMMCPHCDMNLSTKTWRRHKALFFQEDGTWVKMYQL